MSWTPPPGTIGLTHLYGSATIRAALGCRLLDDDSTYSHAFIVLDHGLVAEAWPTGARVVPLRDFDREDVAFGWLPGLTGDQQRQIMRSAVKLLDIGYGVLDYWALGRYRQGSLNRLILRRVTSTDHLLPAQFVSQAYRDAGIHLIPGQNYQDVTLGELGELFLHSADWELRVPCTLYA